MVSVISSMVTASGGPGGPDIEVTGGEHLKPGSGWGNSTQAFPPNPERGGSVWSLAVPGGW